MANGLLDRVIATRNVATQSSRMLSVVQPNSGGMGGGFSSLVRAYQRNPTVNAGLNLLATSASEPQFMGLRNRRGKTDVVRQKALMRTFGIHNRAGSLALTAGMVLNGFVEQLSEHPLVKLLNNPNPFRTGDAFWMGVVLDYYIDGNAYIYKARTDLGNVRELWRLRPDKVTPIPANPGFIAAYSYRPDHQRFLYPVEDIIHWRAPNPMDDRLGASPLLAIIDVLDIDNDLKTFLKSFFRSGGSGPGAILTVSGSLTDDEKKEILDRKDRLYGGAAGAHQWMIIDNMESKFEHLGLDRGLRDAVPKEIAAMVAAEISMNLGIPASILGQLIGLESSSYANKRADWQVLWDVKLTPLMSGLDGALNLSFFPSSGAEFGGIDEVYTDLSNIRALQEDEDALQDRARKNVLAGLWSFEEGRLSTGKDPHPTEGTFFVPSNAVATPIERLGVEPEPIDPPAPAEPPITTMTLRPLQLTEGIRGPGRPPLIADASARAVYEEAERIREKNPRMTLAQVASRAGISERQYQRYRAEFGS